MKPYLAFITAFCFVFWPQSPAFSAQTIGADSSAAVILAYHRIGEDQYPDTNIRTAQFEDHIHELTSGTYHVMALADIVQAIQNNKKLPPYSVAITFEGGYRSILDHALPLLLKKGLPFTIFYASDQADGDLSQYLSWKNLKNLKKNPLVNFGVLPASYTRLSEAPREEILRQINKARSAHQNHFGAQPQFFSYPFGEYNLQYREIVKSQGFIAGFGLQSGVAYAGHDLYTLPRFTMTESYGDTERFRLVTRALPLPVTDIEPEDPHLTGSTQGIGFSVEPDLMKDIANLSCFVSGQKDTVLDIVGGNRVELRTPEPFANDRIRVNCTMPGPDTEHDETPVWRWFGMLLVNTNTHPQPDAPLPPRE